MFGLNNLDDTIYATDFLLPPTCSGGWTWDLDLKRYAFFLAVDVNKVAHTGELALFRRRDDDGTRR